MTLVIYEPSGPALEFIGHADSAPPGRDLVCAALSTLLYTLTAALRDPEIREGEGWCRVSAGEKGREKAAGARDVEAAFRVILAGLSLLTRQYPEHVRLLIRPAEKEGKT